MTNERRLISADEIEELFYKQVEYGATDLMDAFDDALQDCQTVDAEEVVRCKDCVWWNKVGCAICINCDEDKPTENDFCSFGERRCRCGE